MLHYIASYCTMLHYTVSACAILEFIALQCLIYRTILPYTALYCIRLRYSFMLCRFMLCYSGLGFVTCFAISHDNVRNQQNSAPPKVRGQPHHSFHPKCVHWTFAGSPSSVIVYIVFRICASKKQCTCTERERERERDRDRGTDGSIDRKIER